ncbi:hypothetical protein BaRGS_00022714 [Batillaria attramentaria]|uniref:Uncharacterized protein n=1 Tax=Batillaria attramentaria TaxID=370345 RepID=A0ABD0KG04_9CAEN
MDMSERTPLLRPAPIITSSTPHLVEPEDHVPLLEKEESACERYLSGRWVLCYMGLWMYLLLFCARVCISMAIVCMSGLPGTPVLNVSSHNTSFALAYTSTSLSAERIPGSDQSAGLDNITDMPSPHNDYIPHGTEGLVLSAYFYGYIVTPLLGGMVSERLGAKRVITVSMTMSAVATLLTPAAIRFNVYMAVAMRVLLGHPCAEFDVHVGTVGSARGEGKTDGYQCGCVPVDEGWPFIFYVYGAASLLWVFLWQLLVHDTPEQHSRISDKERNLLVKLHSPSRVEKTQKKMLPLASALTNPPTIAMMMSQVSDKWMSCLIGIYLPIYLNQMMYFDMQMLRALAVVLMAVLTGVQTANRSGYVLNRLDLAPRYAGSLAGVAQTVACIGQIVNPLITSAIVSDQRQESWREVFFITAFISIISTVVYLVLGSAEEQEWAKDTSLNQTVMYTAGDVKQ